MPIVRVAKTAEDVFDLNTLSHASSGDDIRHRAITAIEMMPEVNDSAKTRMTSVVGRLPAEVALRQLVTSSEHYRTATQKAMAGQQGLWSPQEQDAVRAALSLTGNAGGFAVPFNLDPTVISTKDTSTNPFRRISRVVQGVTDDWNGVTSAGVTASFDAEGSEVSDDAPCLPSRR